MCVCVRVFEGGKNNQKMETAHNKTAWDGNDTLWHQHFSSALFCWFRMSPTPQWIQVNYNTVCSCTGRKTKGVQNQNLGKHMFIAVPQNSPEFKKYNKMTPKNKGLSNSCFFQNTFTFTSTYLYSNIFPLFVVSNILSYQGCVLMSKETQVCFSFFYFYIYTTPYPYGMQ